MQDGALAGPVRSRHKVHTLIRLPLQHAVTHEILQMHPLNDAQHGTKVRVVTAGCGICNKFLARGSVHPGGGVVAVAVLCRSRRQPPVIIVLRVTVGLALAVRPFPTPSWLHKIFKLGNNTTSKK
jgi:hypothetical protein